MGSMGLFSSLAANHHPAALAGAAKHSGAVSEQGYPPVSVDLPGGVTGKW